MVRKIMAIQDLSITAKILSTRSSATDKGKLRFTFRYGASGVIDRTVPFASHTVKNNTVIFIKIQFDKFHHRNVLV